MPTTGRPGDEDEEPATGQACLLSRRFNVPAKADSDVRSSRVAGLNPGQLIYAKGNEHPARHTVRHSGIEILCPAIDLSPAPAELLSQIGDLAGLIAAIRLEPITLPM